MKEKIFSFFSWLVVAAFALWCAGSLLYFLYHILYAVLAGVGIRLPHNPFE
ncbi:MAG: hypothetical protein IJ461_06035 [Clostridia bacterium]|nr:hypothetical protein [Clostridia bacterium]